MTCLPGLEMGEQPTCFQEPTWMLRSTGQWQGNRTPDNQAANKLVDAGGIWFEDVGSTPTASMFINLDTLL